MKSSMARVSQAHLDARRRQILDAARRCFARNGFHATSMQHVLREANLSAGAVYRYFKSKDEIIAAITSEALDQLTQTVEDVLDTDSPPPLDEALGSLADALERLGEERDFLKVAVQVWGEAVRSPALAERFVETFSGIRSSLARLVEVYQQRGEIDPDVPAEDVAALLAGLLQGFVVQRNLVAGADAATFRSGLRALLAG
jgi:TetR/AcrR family transcriptional regulator, transcriptional repressor of aconitase